MTESVLQVTIEDRTRQGAEAARRNTERLERQLQTTVATTGRFDAAQERLTQRLQRAAQGAQRLEVSQQRIVQSADRAALSQRRLALATQRVEEAERQAANAGSRLEDSLRNIVLGAAGAITALVALTNQQAEFFRLVEASAFVSNRSIEDVTRLIRTFELYGIEIGSTEDALRTFYDRLGDARADPNIEAAQIFRAIGLDINRADVQLEEFLSRLEQLDRASQIFVIETVIGGEGAQLLRAFQDQGFQGRLEAQVVLSAADQAAIVESDRIFAQAGQLWDQGVSRFIIGVRDMVQGTQRATDNISAAIRGVAGGQFFAPVTRDPTGATAASSSADFFRPRAGSAGGGVSLNLDDAQDSPPTAERGPRGRGTFLVGGDQNAYLRGLQALQRQNAELNTEQQRIQRDEARTYDEYIQSRFRAIAAEERIAAQQTRNAAILREIQTGRGRVAGFDFAITPEQFRENRLFGGEDGLGGIPLSRLAEDAPQAARGVELLSGRLIDLAVSSNDSAGAIFGLISGAAAGGGLGLLAGGLGILTQVLGDSAEASRQAAEAERQRQQALQQRRDAVLAASFAARQALDPQAIAQEQAALFGSFRQAFDAVGGDLNDVFTALDEIDNRRRIERQNQIAGQDDITIPPALGGLARLLRDAIGQNALGRAFGDIDFTEFGVEAIATSEAFADLRMAAKGVIDTFETERSVRLRFNAEEIALRDQFARDFRRAGGDIFEQRRLFEEFEAARLGLAAQERQAQAGINRAGQAGFFSGGGGAGQPGGGEVEFNDAAIVGAIGRLAGIAENQLAIMGGTLGATEETASHISTIPAMVSGQDMLLSDVLREFPDLQRGQPTIIKSLLISNRIGDEQKTSLESILAEASGINQTLANGLPVMLPAGEGIDLGVIDATALETALQGVVDKFNNFELPDISTPVIDILSGDRTVRIGVNLDVDRAAIDAADLVLIPTREDIQSALIPGLPGAVNAGIARALADVNAQPEAIPIELNFGVPTREDIQDQLIPGLPALIDAAIVRSLTNVDTQPDLSVDPVIDIPTREDIQSVLIPGLPSAVNAGIARAIVGVEAEPELGIMPVLAIPTREDFQTQLVPALSGNISSAVARALPAGGVGADVKISPNLIVPSREDLQTALVPGLPDSIDAAVGRGLANVSSGRDVEIDVSPIPILGDIPDLSVPDGAIGPLSTSAALGVRLGPVEFSLPQEIDTSAIALPDLGVSKALDISLGPIDFSVPQEVDTQTISGLLPEIGIAKSFDVTLRPSFGLDVNASTEVPADILGNDFSLAKPLEVSLAPLEFNIPGSIPAVPESILGDQGIEKGLTVDLSLVEFSLPQEIDTSAIALPDFDISSPLGVSLAPLEFNIPGSVPAVPESILGNFDIARPLDVALGPIDFDLGAGVDTLVPEGIVGNFGVVRPLDVALGPIDFGLGLGIDTLVPEGILGDLGIFRSLDVALGPIDFGLDLGLGIDTLIPESFLGDLGIARPLDVDLLLPTVDDVYSSITPSLPVAIDDGVARALADVSIVSLEITPEELVIIPTQEDFTTHIEPVQPRIEHSIDFWQGEVAPVARIIDSDEVIGVASQASFNMSVQPITTRGQSAINAAIANISIPRRTIHLSDVFDVVDDISDEIAAPEILEGVAF